MGKEHEENQEVEEVEGTQTQTITKDLETVIKEKEEVLEEFQEVTPDEQEDEELETVNKFGKFKTIAYVLLFSVGVVALIKGAKNKANNDKQVVQVQGDE